jgi:anti-anti-sigma factor
VIIHSKEQAMSATISTVGKVARINLSGEFDFSSQEELKLIFDKVLNAATNEIRIDMQKTTFIDSSVIRMLLRWHETAQRNAKSLTIVNCNERILEILTMGGFDQIFDIR